MKNCNEINELISMYIDNEIDENVRKEMDEHFETCEKCQKELKEIEFIANMCSGSDICEVDLPENFKQDLHQKLVQAGEQEKKKVDIVALRNKYIKILSTVAASILVIVIMKGMWGDVGLWSDKTDTQSVQSKSEDKAELNIEVDSADESSDNSKKIFPKDQPAPMEAKPSTGESPKQAPAVAFSVGDGNAPDAKKPQARQETAKSQPKEQTEKSLPEVKEAQQPEAPQAGVRALTTALAVKDMNIIINTQNPDSVLDKVKEQAAAYEVESDDSVKAYGATSISEDENKQLNIKLPASQYQQFIEVLKTDIGQDIEINPLEGESKAVKKEELQKQLEELDSRIKQIEDSSNISNPDEVNDLKLERDNVALEIKKLEEEQDKITVIININKK